MTAYSLDVLLFLFGTSLLVHDALKSANQLTLKYYRLSGAYQVAQLVKNLPANAGDMSLIPGSGRSLGEIHGHQPQHSCLGKPMNKGVWQVTVHGVPKE